MFMHRAYVDPDKSPKSYFKIRYLKFCKKNFIQKLFNPDICVTLVDVLNSGIL